MLQPGRSPVRVPNVVNFFNLPNPSSLAMVLGSTQPLIEMSTRDLPGCKQRPARTADNLATICEPKGLHGLYRDSFTFSCLRPLKFKRRFRGTCRSSVAGSK
jgi:hypothetical protein